MTSNTYFTHSATRISTYIVIAAFNEAQKIGVVVRGLRREYPHVVVVDDGSSDQTGALAKEAGAVVLRHVFNRGQGAALRTGLDYALSKGAEYVVTFDGDGQHRAEDIPRLLEPLVKGECDVTLGSRFLGDSNTVPWVRRHLLRAAVVVTRLTSGIRLSDCHNGLRAFSRRAIPQIEITMDGMAHASEILDKIARSNLKFCEVPVTIDYTAYSRRKGQRTLSAFPVAADYLFNKFLK